MAVSQEVSPAEDQALNDLGDSFLEQIKASGIDISAVPESEKTTALFVVAMQSVLLACVRAFPDGREDEVFYLAGMACGNVVGQCFQPQRAMGIISLIQGLNEGAQSVSEGFATEGTA